MPTEHALRRMLVEELHARPSMRFSAPATVCFVAVQDGGGPPPEPGGESDSKLGPEVLLHSERHSEFVSHMTCTEGMPQRLFDPERFVLERDWPVPDQGRRVAAIMVEVLPLPDTDADVVALAEAHLSKQSLLISRVQEGQVVVAGDFRLDDQGCMRFLVLAAASVGPGRTGRVVRRLLEVETYRALSMLAFAQVGDVRRQLNGIEPELSALTQQMSDPEHSAEDTLADLMDISAHLERLSSQIDFRFGASHAYESLVLDRLAALGESRFAGRQLMSEFLNLRYTPAMRTVAAVEARLQRMTERAGRAGDLLRARVDVARQLQNQDLLRSMDHRSELQLKLQHAVEGLSVVAVSYYAVGLLAYLLAEPVAELGVSKGWLEVVLVPVVVLLVWLSIHRARRHSSA